MNAGWSSEGFALGGILYGEEPRLLSERATNHTAKGDWRSWATEVAKLPPMSRHWIGESLVTIFQREGTSPIRGVGASSLLRVMASAWGDPDKLINLATRGVGIPIFVEARFKPRTRWGKFIGRRFIACDDDGDTIPFPVDASFTREQHGTAIPYLLENYDSGLLPDEQLPWCLQTLGIAKGVVFGSWTLLDAQMWVRSMLAAETAATVIVRQKLDGAQSYGDLVVKQPTLSPTVRRYVGGSIYLAVDAVRRYCQHTGISFAKTDALLRESGIADPDYEIDNLGRWTPFRAEHLCYVMRDLP